MHDFSDRLKLDNSQRHEVETYLKSITVFSEEVILKLVRKLKEMERRINDLEDTKRYSNEK